MSMPGGRGPPCSDRARHANRYEPDYRQRHEQIRPAQTRAWARMHPKLESQGQWADLDRPPGHRRHSHPTDRGPPGWCPEAQNRVAVDYHSLSGTVAGVEHWWSMYCRCFDIEHTLRFIKQHLGWTTPGYATSKPPTGGPCCSSSLAPNSD